MASPTTGVPAGFSAPAFRDAIKFAMRMGSPNQSSEKVTFQWKTRNDYAKEDILSQPYDWTSTPTSTDSRPDVKVDCAVEFGRIAGGVTERTVMGDFDTNRAVITVLDVDYALIEGADYAVIGGNTYIVEYVQPLALFTVDVYQLHAVALDES
jgi:hypothetical protein